MNDRDRNGQDFFDAHAPYDLHNGLVTHTVAELDFVIKHPALPEHARVLDAGRRRPSRTERPSRHRGQLAPDGV